MNPDGAGSLTKVPPAVIIIRNHAKVVRERSTHPPPKEKDARRLRDVPGKRRCGR